MDKCKKEYYYFLSGFYNKDGRTQAFSIELKRDSPITSIMDIQDISTTVSECLDCEQVQVMNFILLR